MYGDYINVADPNTTDRHFCLLVPITRNSVLSSFNMNLSLIIHERTSVMQFSIASSASASHVPSNAFLNNILPYLDYCSAVWGCIGNGLSQKLEKLQNRAARIITGSSWDARSGPILHALKWNSLADRRAKQLKSLMFKTVINLVPEYACLTNSPVLIPSTGIIFEVRNITCLFRDRTLRPSRKVFVIGAL